MSAAGAARWDVQVLGLDQGKTTASVADAVARLLGAEIGQVERLLAHAPTTLVADLDEAAAKTLVGELRALGVRVKPRPSGSDVRGSVPAPAMTVPQDTLREDRATAPTVALPIPATRASPLGEAPSAERSSSRSPLENLSERALSVASGLELEDVPLPSARPKSLPPPRDARPTAVREPALLDTRTVEEEAPRVFWSALPSAFLVPLRGPVLPGLFLAPLFMGAAVICSLLGSFVAIVGVVVMSAAFIGVTLQVGHRCLWATAVGERIPASLPSGFLAEYAFPGMGVVIVQGLFGGAIGWLTLWARAQGVPMFVIQIAMLFFALYGVIGFALAAANRSAMGFLDVARIVRILVRAPLEVIAIAVIGAIVQGGAIALAAFQIGAAFGVGGIGTALLALAGSTLVLSFAAGYGSALAATMMGMLFWARPEVAG